MTWEKNNINKDLGQCESLFTMSKYAKCHTLEGKSIWSSSCASWCPLWKGKLLFGIIPLICYVLWDQHYSSIQGNS